MNEEELYPPEKLAMKKDKWDKLSIILRLISANVVALGVVAFFYFAQSSKIEIGSLGVKISKQSQVEKELVEKLSGDVSRIEEQLKIMSTISNDEPIAPKIAQIEAEIKALKEQIKTIGSVIMDSPEKALQVPFLRRDIDAFCMQFESSLVSLEKEVSRAYDTMKWVIGTIVLGILGLTASVFIREKK